MADYPVEDLGERIAFLESEVLRLEQANRATASQIAPVSYLNNLKIFYGFILFLAGALSVSIGRSTAGLSNSVETEKLVLKDSDGNVRAVMAAGSDDLPFLKLFGRKGNTLLSITAGPSTPTGMSVHNEQGEEQFFAGRSNALSWGLIVKDEKQVLRTFLGTDKDNAEGLFLYDSRGQLRVKIGLTQEGTPEIVFYDKAGMPVYSSNIEHFIKRTNLE